MRYKTDKDLAGNTYHQEFLESAKKKGRSSDEAAEDMSLEFHHDKETCCGMILKLISGMVIVVNNILCSTQQIMKQP